MIRRNIFRIGLIGAGAISRNGHLPAILASHIAELAAIVDPIVSQAKELCGEYGLKVPIFDEIDAVDVQLDGAIIAAPNYLHAPLAKNLLNRNIHVLVEKPLATTVLDAQEVVDLAKSKNLVLAVGYHTRHSGACQTLKYCVESNQFGKIRRFAHQSGTVGGWAPDSGYNLNRKQAGGGVLVTTGTHFLDRLIWVLGYPNKLELYDDAEGGPESHCIACFEIRNDLVNARGSAYFSKILKLPGNSVFETDQGMLIMANDSDESIFFLPSDNRRLRYEVKLDGGRSEGRGLYQRQLEDFIVSCQSGASPSVTGEDGLKSVILVSDLYKVRQPLSGTNNEKEGSTLWR